MFEHVVLFLSFIYALAISHVLTTTTELIQSRERVTWSPILVCWMVIALLLLTHNWLAIFRLAAIKQWTMAEVLLHFFGALCLYFACSLTSMRVEQEGRVDMPAFFDRNRGAILSAFLVFSLIAITINIADRNVIGDPANWGLARVWIILPVTLALIAALAIKARWLQWSTAIFVLLHNVYFMARFVAAG